MTKGALERIIILSICIFLMLSIGFGFVLPVLINSTSNLAVGLGFVLLIALLLGVYKLGNQIYKNFNNEEGRNDRKS